MLVKVVPVNRTLMIVMIQYSHYVLPVKQAKRGHRQFDNGSSQLDLVNDTWITSIEVTAKLLYQLSQWNTGWRQNWTPTILELNFHRHFIGLMQLNLN